MMRWFDAIRRLWRNKRWVKWAVYLLPVLAVLVLLGPALGVLNQLLKLGVGVLLPLLKTSAGRFLILNLVLVGMVLLIYWKGRGRIQALFAYLALRHFLRGLELLAGGFPRRAARSFRRVLRVARWVNLEQGLPAYPEIAPAARVRLAMCHLRLGETNKALRWLELAQKDRPPPGVMKLLRELRAVAYFDHPSLARETVEKELEEAHRRDPGNIRLNRAMVRKCRESGEDERVIELLKRIHGAAEGRDREREAVQLLAHYHERACALIEAGDHARARSLLREARGLEQVAEPIQLLLGELEAKRKNPDHAVLAWAKTPGPAARARVAALLDQVDDPRDVLKRYPHPDLLIDLARRLFERGSHDQARRTLDRARDLGADPAEVEQLLGDLEVAASEPMRARSHYLKAITHLFGGKLVPGDDP